jgi:hypothetical protein
MKRLLGPLMVLAVVAASCAGGDSTRERTVLVDFSSDRFGSFFLYNFPKKIAVHPGTTLIFRQTWTGEPHTVTAGRLVNDVLATAQPLLQIFVNFDLLKANGAAFPDPENPGDAKFTDFTTALATAQPEASRREFIDAWNELRRAGVKLAPLDNPPDVPFGEASKAIDETANKVFEELPFAFDEESGGITQNMGQPCYRRTGGPPKDSKTPCSKAQQRQPAFDGNASFYNSGIIPYEGAQGNTFRVRLAENIKTRQVRVLLRRARSATGH